MTSSSFSVLSRPSIPIFVYFTSFPLRSLTTCSPLGRWLLVGNSQCGFFFCWSGSEGTEISLVRWRTIIMFVKRLSDRRGIQIQRCESMFVVRNHNTNLIKQLYTCLTSYACIRYAWHWQRSLHSHFFSTSNTSVCTLREYASNEVCNLRGNTVLPFSSSQSPLTVPPSCSREHERHCKNDENGKEWPDRSHFESRSFCMSIVIYGPSLTSMASFYKRIRQRSMEGKRSNSIFLVLRKRT